MRTLNTNKRSTLNFKIIKQMLESNDFVIDIPSADDAKDISIHAHKMVERNSDKLEEMGIKKLNSYKIQISAGHVGGSSEKIDGEANDFKSVFLKIEIPERNITIEKGFVNFKILYRFLASPNELCDVLFDFI